MNGGTATEPAAPAFKTAFTFEKLEIPPSGEIEAAFFEVDVGIVYPGFAMRADQTHQALCQNAIESRDEVVQVDTDVQEPAEYVKHVVGVDSCENQVTGE